MNLCFDPKHAAAVAVLLVAGAVSMPLRAETALVQGGAIAILPADVQADVQQRVPEEVRSAVLGQSKSVAQIAGNLYVRRAMAGLADAAGMRERPEVLAAVNIARDRALSDAWLAKIDREATPAQEVVEQIARERYRANPARFTTEESRRLRHILVKGIEPESRAQAEKLLQELRAGESFERLAKEHSADERSGEKGGDLGFVERGRMVPEFESAAYSLKEVNDLSGVVATKFGYHVIQLAELKPRHVQPFEDVRTALEKEVIATLRQEARAAEAQRLQSAMVTDADAINAFVARQAPIEVQ